MNGQTNLFAANVGSNRYEEKYRAWKVAHPHIYRGIKEAALRKAKFSDRVGVKAVVEEVRQDARYRRPDGEAYKINNAFTSLLARDLIADHPELSNKIELRRMSK